MFTVTEPHPTLQANAYTHAGRGGAGNTFRAPSDVTPATGVPVPLLLTKSDSHGSYTSTAGCSAQSSVSTRFYAGRGGAGNACPATERRRISLDDEYAYASAVARASASGHVGRGGAGNFYKTPADVSSLTGTPATPVTFTSTADRIAQSLRKLGGRRKGSDASSASDSSVSSVNSARSGFLARR